MTTNPTICECCEEREVHDLCRGHCPQCWAPSVCDQCASSEVGEDDIDEAGWTPENQVDVLCESCRQGNAASDWLHSTIEQIESAANGHGWTLDESRQAQTGSRYLTFTRIDESDDDAEVEEVKIRVSDHGDCYCRSDFSVSMSPTPDDHTIEEVVEFLSRPIGAAL